MAFSENLRTARRVKNLSHEQLAELLSVSRQAISKWELDDGYGRQLFCI
jgi:transcriptional regulator with XRE-family HTH domain